jgi:hypothetical protein
VAFVVAVAASFLMSGRAKAQACRPDLNGDERVDGIDLGILLGAWGLCPPGIESVSPTRGWLLKRVRCMAAINGI